MFRNWLQRAIGLIRRRLPLRLRFRLRWARLHGRPDYLWMAYPVLARRVLRQLFQSNLGYEPNLDQPQSINEKIQWRKLHDRRKLLVLAVDKYRVREYVNSRIGGEYLIPLLHVCEHPEQIPFTHLQPPYIIKPNNGSGMKIIVRESQDLDVQKSVRQLRHWMREVYGLARLEWAYAEVPPRILVERLLSDSDERPPRDYKFHVFDGRVAFLHVDQDRDTDLRTLTYDRDWRPVALKYRGFQDGDFAPPPPNAHLMIELAEKIAADLDYARIDFYNIDGQIYFGEITIYPDSGLTAFNPPEWDRRWGELWTLPHQDLLTGK